MNVCPETHDFRYRGPDFTVLGFFVLVLTLPFWIDPRNLPSTQDPDAFEMLAFARVFVAFRESAAPKFLVDKNGSLQNNMAYRGEVYCATVQSSDCDIEQFIISYNRLTVSTGQNFTEPSRIIFNFNYDPRWSTSQGTIRNHNGLLAVELPGGDNRNQRLVLSYRDRLFFLGIVFFFLISVASPVWYFWYYNRVAQSRDDIFSVM